MQFNFFKTRVKLSFSFWAVVTVLLMLDRSNTAIISLISAVLHEMGHLITLCCFSSPPQSLTFGFFGMRIEKKENELSFMQEAQVAFAGPLVNIIISILSLILYKFYTCELIIKICTVNLLMGIFNLVPIEPLDGARVIKNTLSIFLDEQCINKAMNVFLYLFLGVLFWLSIKILIWSGYNFTLLLFCVYISLCIIFKKK